MFLNLRHYPPNANMADHSVGARDEFQGGGGGLGGEASEASVLCFDNASSERF